MANKIILSADSTCDMGDELKARYDVNYYPFHIILEDKDYQDNVDITVKEIFAAYYDRKALPRTAAINIGEYVDYFKGWVNDGYDVIHLNLGGAISSAHKNCVLAARELMESGAPGRVYPIDSFNLSTAIALQVIDAGDMIAAGLPAADSGEAGAEPGQCPHKLHPGHPGLYAGRGALLHRGGGQREPFEP